MFTECCVKTLEQIECCSRFPQCPFTNDNAGGAKRKGGAARAWLTGRTPNQLHLSHFPSPVPLNNPLFPPNPHMTTTRNGAVIHYRLVARDSEPLQVATDTAWSRLPVSVQVTIPFFQISSNRYRGSTTRTNKHYQLRATLCSFLQYCFVSDNG